MPLNVDVFRTGTASIDTLQYKPTRGFVRHFVGPPWAAAEGYANNGKVRRLERQVTQAMRTCRFGRNQRGLAN